MSIGAYVKEKFNVEDENVVKLMTEEREEVDDKTYMEVLRFLNYEADLLDTWKYYQWLDLFTDDCEYVMYVRITKPLGQGYGISPYGHHFLENKRSLKMRVDRIMMSGSAWAEDPPSRHRHFVTNVRVFKGSSPNEVIVKSSVLYTRQRNDEPHMELMTYLRIDTLVKKDGKWYIKKRYIIPDQTVLLVKNLSVFY